VRLAFVIVAHRSAAQLARLATRLASPETGLFVHIDRQVNAEVWHDAVERLSALPSVSFLPRRRVRWGTFDLVDVTLSGLASARAAGFDYVTAVTGQDYPIKPVQSFTAFLDANQGRSFLPHFPLRPGPWVDNGGLRRVDHWHFLIGGRWLSFPNRYIPLPVRRTVPSGLTPYGGSAYWCLGPDCADYVLDFVADHPEVSRFFRTTPMPDEVFYQTVLATSPLQPCLIDDDLRFVDWTRGDPHPKTLTAADFPRIAAAAGFLARKFDIDVDARVLDLIDAELLYPVGTQTLPESS
jgi:hypothetical protein